MKQTAIEWLIEQLQAPCRGIPSIIIEQAKEMEHKRVNELITALNKISNIETTDLLSYSKGLLDAKIIADNALRNFNK